MYVCCCLLLFSFCKYILNQEHFHFVFDFLFVFFFFFFAPDTALSRFVLLSLHLLIFRTQTVNNTCIHISPKLFFPTPQVLNIIHTVFFKTSAYSEQHKFILKGVLHLWALFLKALCIFSKNKSNFGQSILWIWSEMFQGTQKSQFHFSRDHCCEVTVKNVRKSIFSMF